MKLLIVGLGSMGKRRARLSKGIDAALHIVGVDTAEARRAEACTLGLADAAYPTIAEAVAAEHPDAALVCTAPLSHAAVIGELLDSDLPVFTELNLVGDGYAENMAKAAAKNLPLFLSSTMLYRRETQYIKQQVQAFGKPVHYIYHIGQYLPDYILTNEELSTMVDTTDEWIMSHIGVKTRHILKGEGVGSSYMGARAVINLLDKAGVDPMEVDLVICATVTPDMFFPSTGNLIADQAGCKNAFAYDVSAACSGFLFALTTGAKFIESGSCKKVVVVGADKMSTIVDYTDRSTCPIFGDGAAAVLLEPNTEGYGVLDEILRSDGSGELQLYMKAGGSRYPASIETVQNNWHTIMWDGHAVFKAAVSKMADVSVEIMERNNLTSDDIRYLVPHQANLRIIDATARRMGLDHDKCMINIDRNGNTTAATIPSCLYDYEKELKPGDNLILSAFGGGYTWGAIYVKWAYDGSKACQVDPAEK